MTTEMTVFKFKEAPVRIIEDEKGEPWFVAKDVCDILGLSHVTNALKVLDGSEKGSKPITTPGGTQLMKVMNETGRYRLTMRCDKPQAKPFQDWVVKEVLPTIRKTGAFSTGIADLTTIEGMKVTLQLMTALVDKMGNIEQRMDRNEAAIAELKISKPDVLLLKPVIDYSERVRLVLHDWIETHSDNPRVTWQNVHSRLNYRFLIRHKHNISDLGKKRNKSALQVAIDLGMGAEILSLAQELVDNNFEGYFNEATEYKMEF